MVVDVGADSVVCDPHVGEVAEFRVRVEAVDYNSMVTDSSCCMLG